MGILGLIVQLLTAVFAFYLGLTFQLNPVFLLVCPLGFIVGHLMRRSTGASSKNREHGIGALISSYLVGLVLVAIFFGIGYGVMHILDLRPAEGVGRYQ